MTDYPNHPVIKVVQLLCGFSDISIVLGVVVLAILSFCLVSLVFSKCSKLAASGNFLGICRFYTEPSSRSIHPPNNCQNTLKTKPVFQLDNCNYQNKYNGKFTLYPFI